jgi:methionyl-tRNA formyltransferase
LNHQARSLRLAFAGTPPFAVAALDALHRARHQMLGVFTQADRPAGRGRVLRESAVKQRARELGLPVHQPASFKSAEALALLRALKLDALVVAAYGLILPADALNVPALGCVNIHASLLPRWRGAAPVQRAILAADRATGITIMRMERGLDTGPVLAARSIAIESDDTAGSLQERLAVLGGELIVTTLDDLAAGRITAIPQPAAGVTYAAKIDKSEALIDWRDAAADIWRKVRAFNPWPIAETRFSSQRLRIWEAQLPAGAASTTPGGAPPGTAPPGTVLGVSKQGIDVACGQGVLRITRLQLPGGKPLAAGDFLNAQPLAGASFTGPREDMG